MAKKPSTQPAKNDSKVNTALGAAEATPEPLPDPCKPETPSAAEATPEPAALRIPALLQLRMQVSERREHVAPGNNVLYDLHLQTPEKSPLVQSPTNRLLLHRLSAKDALGLEVGREYTLTLMMVDQAE